MELPICEGFALFSSEGFQRSWRLSFEPGLVLCRARVVVDRKKPSMTQSALEGIHPSRKHSSALLLVLGI